jgi:hypothetical protein
MQNDSGQTKFEDTSSAELMADERRVDATSASSYPVRLVRQIARRRKCNPAIQIRMQFQVDCVRIENAIKAGFPKVPDSSGSSSSSDDVSFQENQRCS